jgi:predicted nucleotidyltransferase
MLLHTYLEDVLGNKIALGILRTMTRYRGKVFTVRSLAETAGVSTSEAALTAHKFEELGLMTIQPVGRAYHLQLNEKSYILNKIVKPILDAEKNTMSELLRILRKHLNKKKIVSAALFGSVVRGEERQDSDIDLLLVSNDRDAAISAVSGAALEVAEILRGNLSHIIFSEKQLRSKKKDDLIRTIISDHILVCGREIADI